MKSQSPSIETLIYCAGYFDGEGTINFTYNGKTNGYVLKVSVCSGDLEALQVFAETLGGSVREHNRTKPNARRQMWNVTFHGRRAQEVVRQLLPYMHTRHIIAEAVLKVSFMPQGGNSRVGLSTEEKAYRDVTVELVTSYNNRTTLLEKSKASESVN